MKTFKNFKSFILNEDYSKTPISKEDTIDFILENCQQWFQEIYGKTLKNEKDLIQTFEKKRFYLYRGIRIDDYSLIETASDNRPPRDTPLPIHNAIVKAMKKLGFSVHRGNCLFATNSRQQAKLYSIDIEPFLVFPIDGYQYTYSPKIKDLYKMVRTVDSILKLNKLFPNIEMLKKYIEEEDYDLEYLEDYPIEEIINTIPDSQFLETIFQVDEQYLKKEYNFKKTDIKTLIFNPKKEIEIMFRPKLFLTQWRP